MKQIILFLASVALLSSCRTVRKIASRENRKVDSVQVNKKDSVAVSKVDSSSRSGWEVKKVEIENEFDSATIIIDLDSVRQIDSDTAQEVTRSPQQPHIEINGAKVRLPSHARRVEIKTVQRRSRVDTTQASGSQETVLKKQDSTRATSIDSSHVKTDSKTKDVDRKVSGTGFGGALIIGLVVVALAALVLLFLYFKRRKPDI